MNTADQKAQQAIPWDRAVTDALGMDSDAVHNTRDIARAAYIKGYAAGQEALPLAMSEEEMEEESHKWANAQAPWEGPVERTYARTVFIDGLRAANTRSKSLTVEKGRTFTEGEVRAMVSELKEEAEDDHVRAWIDGVVTRHGIDPA